MRRRQSAAFVAERESAEDSSGCAMKRRMGGRTTTIRGQRHPRERPHRPGMSAKVILHQSSNNSNGGGEMRKGGAEQSRGLRSSEKKNAERLAQKKKEEEEKKTRKPRL